MVYNVKPTLSLVDNFVRNVKKTIVERDGGRCSFLDEFLNRIRYSIIWDFKGNPAIRSDMEKMLALLEMMYGLIREYYGEWSKKYDRYEVLKRDYEDLYEHLKCGVGTLAKIRGSLVEALEELDELSDEEAKAVMEDHDPACILGKD